MEDNSIKLTEDETRLVMTYQKFLEDTKLSLGMLRSQYLLAEAKFMDRIETAERDMLSHLRMLAQSKEISLEENWFFDSSTFSFVKK